MKLRTYTLKETSKIINVPTSTIKQWEKDLDGLLTIPRSQQGARIYSEIEIDLLLEIKNLVDNHLSKKEIREKLQQQQSPTEQENDEFAISIADISETKDLSTGDFSEVPTELSQWNQEQ